MVDDWAAWGPLAERCRTPGPRRIPALDGGGIRGVITLGVLAGLEQQMRERRGDPDYRLCQFFDLIGGTSTGAIIATGAGLKELGVAGLDPHRLGKLDQVDDIGALKTVGEALGERVSLRHLGWAAA